MAAAVADFRPAPPPTKDQEGRRRPRDRARAHRRHPRRARGPQAPGQTVVGFAAETDDARANAADKLARKGADLIVANDVSAPGVGFEHDTNEVVICRRPVSTRPWR